MEIAHSVNGLSAKQGEKMVLLGYIKTCIWGLGAWTHHHVSDKDQCQMLEDSIQEAGAALCGASRSFRQSAMQGLLEVYQHFVTR